MQINWKVEKLREYLPHRPPMIWVDEVIEMGEESGCFFGSCRTRIDQPNLFFNGEGKIRGSVAIELTAQAYGFSRACFHHVNNIDDTPKTTYLTGIRSCETFFEGFEKKKETELRTEVQVMRKMPPITFIEGTVLGMDDTLYARAEIQVYTV